MSAYSQPMLGLSQSTQHWLDKVCENLHQLTTHRVIMDSISHFFLQYGAGRAVKKKKAVFAVCQRSMALESWVSFFWLSITLRFWMYCLTLVALRRVNDWSESTKYQYQRTYCWGSMLIYSALFLKSFWGKNKNNNIHVDIRIAWASKNILSVKPFCGDEGTAEA